MFRSADLKNPRNRFFLPAELGSTSGGKKQREARILFIKRRFLINYSANYVLISSKMAEMAHRERDLFVGTNAKTQFGPVLEFLESVTHRFTEEHFFAKRLVLYLQKFFFSIKIFSRLVSVINVGMCCYFMYI